MHQRSSRQGPEEEAADRLLKNRWAKQPGSDRLGPDDWQFFSGARVHCWPDPAGAVHLLWYPTHVGPHASPSVQGAQDAGTERTYAESNEELARKTEAAKKSSNPIDVIERKTDTTG